MILFQVPWPDWSNLGPRGAPEDEQGPGALLFPGH